MCNESINIKWSLFNLITVSDIELQMYNYKRVYLANSLIINLS